jgi:hypothetical protein
MGHRIGVKDDPGFHRQQNNALAFRRQKPDADQVPLVCGLG